MRTTHEARSPVSDSSLRVILFMGRGLVDYSNTNFACTRYSAIFEWVIFSIETCEMASWSSCCQTRATVAASCSRRRYCAVASALLRLKNELLRL